jgi:hypothetical protein
MGDDVIQVIQIAISASALNGSAHDLCERALLIKSSTLLATLILTVPSPSLPNARISNAYSGCDMS